MNLLEGSMTLTGEYNTQDINVPLIDLDMNIRQFDITSALSSFSILEKILPEPQNYVGKVSANLNLYGVLDEHMSPVLNTVASNGQLQTHNVEMRNSKLFGTLADLLKNELYRTPSLSNLNIKYEIRDGRLFVEPFQMNIAQTRLELSGSQGLDMTLDYNVRTAVPLSAVGSGAADILSKIPGGSNIRELTVTGLIGGTATSPNVSLSVADMTNIVVEEVKEQVREEIDKQITAVMAEAERQAETIRNTAKQTADRLRSEAAAAANRLEREAASKSIVERTLAKTAADTLRREGETSAVRVEQEAERQITTIMDAARKRAEEIRNN